MAIIKCTECGGSVSDKAETCPHCGAPVKPMLETIEKEKEEAEAKLEAEKQKKAENEKPKSKKTGIIIAIVAIALAIAVFAYYQMTKDEEPPVISGIESGQTIDITCGTVFNLNDYLKENLKITDNKDGDIAEYTITLDEKVYDSESGDINTMQAGSFDAKVDVKDKAENTSSLSFTISLNPIHITKDNLGQTIYDGEYGTIKLASFKHGVINGTKEYEMRFDCTNKDDSIMEMFCSGTFTAINDYQLSAYVELPNTISPEKTKTVICSILDDDIPSDVGEFKTIETAACFAYEGADSIDDHLIRVPIVFDIDAAEQV